MFVEPSSASLLAGLDQECSDSDTIGHVDPLARAWVLVRGVRRDAAELADPQGRGAYWFRIEEVLVVDRLTPPWVAAWRRAREEVDTLRRLLDEPPDPTRRVRFLSQRSRAVEAIQAVARVRLAQNPTPPEFHWNWDDPWSLQQEDELIDRLSAATSPLGMFPEEIVVRIPPLDYHGEKVSLSPPREEGEPAPEESLPDLGLDVSEADEAARAALLIRAGYRVDRIVPFSPAAEAGLRVGDILWHLRLGGGKVVDLEDISWLRPVPLPLPVRPRSRFDLDVLRGDACIEIALPIR